MSSTSNHSQSKNNFVSFIQIHWQPSTQKLKEHNTFSRSSSVLTSTTRKSFIHFLKNLAQETALMKSFYNYIIAVLLNLICLLTRIHDLSRWFIIKRFSILFTKLLLKSYTQNLNRTLFLIFDHTCVIIAYLLKYKNT